MLAVGGVLISHYLPEDAPFQFLPWGPLGVQLFFVISGFLITGILLDLRPDAGSPGLGDALRIFYIRRFLRIFPPYYLLLLVYLVAGIGFPHGAAWACPLYVFNFLALFVNDPFNYLGHLWTLCVEEQFYLVWPFVVLVVPRGQLCRVALLLVIAAPLFRMLLEGIGLPYPAIRNLPLSQFDALAGGALLAMLRNGFGIPGTTAIWEKWRMTVAIAGGLFYLAALKWPFNPMHAMTGATGSALLMMAIVDWAAYGRNGVARHLLMLRPFVYIGKISYGIYLYQFVSLFVVYKLQHLLRHPALMNHAYGFGAVWGVVTLVVAIGSWHLFEQPVLRFKRYFPYHPGVS